MPLLECVPNVSEGRRQNIIEELSGALAGRPGAKLVDVSADRDHNRTVFTLLGARQPLVEVLFELFEVALRRIDLSRHGGVHPRVGVVDVVPFVPLQGARMGDAVLAARDLGRRLGERLGVPVFFYGQMASREELRVPAGLRRLGLEHLTEAIENGGWLPDFGPRKVDPRRGVTLVGARSVLVAFNVLLDTDRVDIARRIAGSVRESGGGLRGVQALGFFLDSRGKAQVSLNLLDPAATSMFEALEHVRREAEAVGTGVVESEIVGLVPQAAVDGSVRESLRLSHFDSSKIVETWYG